MAPRAPSTAVEEDTLRVGRRFLAAAVQGVLEPPLPGSGATGDRLAALAALAADDVALGRLAEGHADAIAILTELTGDAERGQAWGVWAAAPDSLTAQDGPDGWTVTGTRPWCSGATSCTRALVTAAAPGGIRLFAIDLARPGISRLADTWPAVGMAASDTLTVRFDRVPAAPVGAIGAYIDRPGFWHGAIGVAACWYGGAVGVARLLLHRVRAGGTAGEPYALAHLGAVDAALAGAAAILREAAAAIDADPARVRRVEALRVRAAVERAATEVLDRVGRATGAAPLCHDRAHARRVADLTVYLRQSHAERDLAALGELAVSAPDGAWSLAAGSLAAG